MGAVLGVVLPLAVAIAISPVAIGLVVVAVMSGRRASAAGLVCGFSVGVALIVSVALAVSAGADAATDSDTRDGISVVQLGFGLLFVALAVVAWRRRPRSGEPLEEPVLFRAVESLTVVRATGLGGMLASVLAPKNLTVGLSAGASLAEAGLSTGGNVTVVIAVAVVASLGMLTPLVVTLVLGERAAEGLGRARAWLVANNTTIMLVLFTLQAANFLGKGLGLVR